MSYSEVFSWAMSMIDPVLEHLEVLIPIVVVSTVLGFIAYMVKR